MDQTNPGDLLLRVGGEVLDIAVPAGTPLTPAADATRQCLQETVAALLEQGVLKGRLPRSGSHREEPMD